MNYELMFVLKPGLSEEERKVKAEKIKELITKNKGEIVKEEAWGKRVLAYPIEHFNEGIYHLLFFQTTPAGAKELEKKLNLDDEVLRFLIVRSGQAP